MFCCNLLSFDCSRTCTTFGVMLLKNGGSLESAGTTNGSSGSRLDGRHPGTRLRFSPPVTEAALIYLPLLQMSDSVSPRSRRDAPSSRLASSYIIATTYGFKNSILTFSDALLSRHKSDYLHPRRARRADVKGIEFSTAAGGGGEDAKNLKRRWRRGGVAGSSVGKQCSERCRNSPPAFCGCYTFLSEASGNSGREKFTLA